MKIIDKIHDNKATLSFEFFPPKTPEQETNLFAVIGALKQFAPDFVSITYGAMGTTREKTFFWADKIRNHFNLEPIAHLTCVAATKSDIDRQLDALAKIGIENILALRGDPPAGTADFTPPPDGFRYAKELIAHIKRTKPAICVGAAGFPEGHPRSTDVAVDTRRLKEKVEAGAEYVISQLFFDNHYFFKFLERCSQASINVPVIPGLMPITSFKQIKKMTDVCGATIPPPLLAKLERHQADNLAIQQIGEEHALDQANELLRSGVAGLHFFVMNQAGPISTILGQLNFPR